MNLKHLSSSFVIRCALFFVAVASGLHLIAHIYETETGRTLHALNLDSETSIGTWISVLLLALSALIAYELSFRKKNFKLQWKLFAVFLLLLSIDDEASIHEASGDLVAALSLPAIGGRNWIFAGLVVLAVAGVIFFNFMRKLPKRLLSQFALGFGLFFLGAFVVEATTDGVANIANDIFGYGNRVAYAVWLEESLEMAGLFVIFRVLVLELDRYK